MVIIASESVLIVGTWGDGLTKNCPFSEQLLGSHNTVANSHTQPRVHGPNAVNIETLVVSFKIYPTLTLFIEGVI